MADLKITRPAQPPPELIPALGSHELELDLSDPEMAFLRETMSGTEEEIRAKIIRTQKDLYAQFPYMCIRAFQFVATRMARHPVYPQVLREGRTGNTILLDIGCMMGTDARKAVYDGYPAEKVLACDLRLDFIEIGYGLFEDKDKCRIHFFQSDVFEIPLDVSSHDAPVPLKEVSRLEHLQGRVDHIYTGAVFHLFDESTQVAMALRLATLVPKDRPAIIFGRHRGQFTAGLTPDNMGRGPRYIHSPESWKALWESVFRDTHQQVTVAAELVNERQMVWSVHISPK